MEKIQLEDFLDFVAVSAPSAPRSGGAFAWLEHRLDREENTYRHTLAVRRGESVAVVPDALPAEPFWLGSESFLYAAAAPGRGSVFRRYDVDRRSSEAAFFLPVPGRIVAALPDGRYLVAATVNILEQRRIQGKCGPALEAEWAAIDEEKDMCWVLDEFPFWQNGQGLTNKLRTALYLYTPGGEMRRITEELFDTENAVYVPETEEICFHGAAFARQKEYLTGIYAYSLKSGQTRCLLEPGRWEIGFFAAAGGRLAFTACRQDEGKTLAQMHDLYVMHLPEGEMRLLHSGEISFGDAVATDVSYGGGRAFAATETGVYFLACVEEHTRLMHCSWTGELETRLAIRGSINAFALSGEEIVFTALKDMALPEVYRLGPAGEIVPVTAHNGAYCAAHAIADPVPVRFCNGEGVEIHGLVLVPPDYDGTGRWPAILDIHGGPRAAYGEVYYHEMQYWASHGYFVLFCNPTGSLGRGQAFGDVCGRTGQVDFDDLMQFVDEVLARYPAIDADRLGVTGGSYGGFMTNWIIGHTKRFAAAVSQRSTANNISNEATTGNGPLFTRSCLKAGETRSDALLWEQSPLKYADNAVTPTLFIHGLEDYCCYHVEALQMYTALQRLGVDTRVCLFRHENHSLSRSGRPRSRVRRLQEITGWMDKYVQPGRR